MTTMLNIALIGCGGWASQMHVPALKKLQEQGKIRVIGVCDINHDLAQKAATQLGLPKHYSDAQEMIRQEKPQALSILAPCHVTEHLIEQAARQDIPFLTEKPPASSAKKQSELISLVDTLPHLVAYNRRYAPYMEIAHNWMAGQELQSVSATFSRHRRLDPQFSNTFVHGLDAVLSAIGPASDIQAIINKKDDVNNISIHMLGKNNCIGQLLVTPNCGIGMEHYELRSANRFVQIAFPQFGMYDLPGSVTCYENMENKERHDADSLGIKSDDMAELGGIVNEYRHLSDVVLLGKTPRSTLSNTLQTQQIREWLDKQSPGLSQKHL